MKTQTKYFAYSNQADLDAYISTLACKYKTEIGRHHIIGIEIEYGEFETNKTNSKGKKICWMVSKTHFVDGFHVVFEKAILSETRGLLITKAIPKTTIFENSVDADDFINKKLKELGA